MSKTLDSSRLVSAAMQKPLRASVVVPLGHRYEDLAGICRELRRVLTPLIGVYEVIIVDDATGPNTRRRVEELCAAFPEVRSIRLKRFMGESAALAIGAAAATGEVLITFDAYLHVAVDELPKLLAALAGGMDLVCAWRFPRQDRGMGRLASEAFNAAARWLTKVPVHDLNCRTRVMKRGVLEELPIYGDLHRFLPIFAARRGYLWCEVQVPQQPGKTELGPRDPKAYVRRFLDLDLLVLEVRALQSQVFNNVAEFEEVV